MPDVYAFDHPHDTPPMQLAALLGGKGANLAEMSTVLGLPVPPGFTITTAACRAVLAGHRPPDLDAEIADALTRLEAQVGRRLGADQDPLLVSVRSGAASSMPGMLDTILDLGLTDRSVEGLAAATGDERFAFDSYRRFVTMFGHVVLGVDRHVLDAVAAVGAAGGSVDGRVVCADLLRVVEQHAGRPFPQDAHEQLHLAIDAVFASWNGARARSFRAHDGIDDGLGTAVNVQAMVFGNRGPTSGTGVAFSRDPATGERVPYGDFLADAQGEDVVAGTVATEPLAALATRMPAVHAELLTVLDRLEHHFRDLCDTEFTVEQGRLWMLQARVGKRSAAAAVRMAVEMVADLGLTREEAVARVTDEQIHQVLHPEFAASTDRSVVAVGLPASPGAAIGRACFSADAVVDAVANGDAAVLVRAETSPEDVHGMQLAEGILTTRGGLASHAAVVARGWEIPAVVGAADVVIAGASFSAGAVTVREGDVISIDGTTGEVVVGVTDLAPAEPPAELATLLSWRAAPAASGGPVP